LSIRLFAARQFVRHYQFQAGSRPYSAAEQPEIFFEKRGLTVTRIKVNQERQTGQNMYLNKHGVFRSDDEQSARIIGCRKPPMLKTDKLSRKLA
jgi:hypothetical protein